MAEAPPETIVDVVESAFDAELGPDLIAGIDSLPHARLLGFTRRMSPSRRGLLFKA